MQDRKALVVGIDEYASTPLFGCVADAKAVAGALTKNGDGSPNFSIHLERNVESPYALKQMIEDCFSGEPEIALLYFRGTAEDAMLLKAVSSYRDGAILRVDFLSMKFWR